MTYNYQTRTETFSVEDYYKSHGSDWKKYRLSIYNQMVSGKSIHLYLSEGVPLNNNKHSLTTNKLYRIGSYQKFSLEREQKEQIREFLSDPGIIVIHNQKNEKEGVLHLTFTRKDLIDHYLKDIEFLVKADFENLAEKYKKIEEEKAKEREAFISDDDFSEIENLLAARRIA